MSRILRDYARFFMPFPVFSKKSYNVPSWHPYAGWTLARDDINAGLRAKNRERHGRSGAQ